MVPLVMLMTGPELATWRPRDRAIALAAMWLILAVLAQNLISPFGQIPPLVHPPAAL
jgi:hypothetical protein